MEFKKLEIKDERPLVKRLLTSPHIRKTAITMALGAIGGFIYFYITQGQHMDIMTPKDIIKSIGIGAFLGFFITNSPCARGHC